MTYIQQTSSFDSKKSLHMETNPANVHLNQNCFHLEVRIEFEKQKKHGSALLKMPNFCISQRNSVSPVELNSRLKHSNELCINGNRLTLPTIKIIYLFQKVVNIITKFGF